MLAHVLKKIDGTMYKKTLEDKKHERKRLEAAGNDAAARYTKASIAGYCQALRDCGVINDRERGVLFIYYGTV